MTVDLRGFMRWNFNLRSAHETCARDVCIAFGTDDQREQRQSPAICLTVHVKTHNLLRTLWQVTSLGSTGTTRRQNSKRQSGRVPGLCHKTRGARCEAKQRSCYWRFLIEGIVHHEYAPDGQTRKSMRMSCDACGKQFAEKTEKMAWWRWILHHGNAATHTSHPVQQFLGKQHRSVATSAILTRSRTVYFFLFPRLGKVLKGHRFEARTWNEIRRRHY